MAEQFINRIVAFTDSLPSRQVAPLIMPVRPPGGKFLVVGEEDNFGISPDNAVRYQAYIDLAGMVDTDAMVGLYQRYYPLFQQAYEALGYPGAYFNDRLVEVIDHLLATPDTASRAMASNFSSLPADLDDSAHVGRSENAAARGRGASPDCAQPPA